MILIVRSYFNGCGRSVLSLSIVVISNRILYFPGLGNIGQLTIIGLAGSATHAFVRSSILPVTTYIRPAVGLNSILIFPSWA